MKRGFKLSREEVISIEMMIQLSVLFYLFIYCTDR